MKKFVVLLADKRKGHYSTCSNAFSSPINHLYVTQFFDFFSNRPLCKIQQCYSQHDKLYILHGWHPDLQDINNLTQSFHCIVNRSSCCAQLLSQCNGV